MAKISIPPGWTGGEGTGGTPGNYVPDGGMTGDHLIKNSDLSGDYSWETPPPMEMPPDSMEGMWMWMSDPIDTIPDSGMVGVDTDDPREATMLYINWYDMDGVERASMLAGGGPGDEITFTVVGDPESWHRYAVLGPVETNPPGYQMPIQTVIGSPTGTEPATGAELVVVLDHGGGSSGLQTGDLAYLHVQTAPSLVWVINHNLSFRPNISVTDSAGTEIWPGDIVYTSSTQVQLTFSAAVGGEAYLS